jgi:hypothetical protein
MTDSMTERERRFQLWGWGLFILCALLYTASSLESGSLLGLAGSLVFLIACFVFLLPLLRRE